MSAPARLSGATLQAVARPSRVVTACMWTLLLTPGAHAGPGADALAAGDYKRALTILEPQARRGQAEAQYLLGRMRALGLGMPVDLERARFWYGQAAAQGYRQAREALANLDAPSGTQAPSAAASPASVAAPAAPTGPRRGDEPDPSADGSTRRLQAIVHGAPRPDAASLARLVAEVEARAEGGDVPAAIILGEYHEAAGATESDLAAAARWYSLAAGRDHPVALNNLGALYYDGRGVVQSHAEAQRLYERAARLGDPVAQFNLALMLGQGRGGGQDLAGMALWLERSAAQDYAPALAQLARLKLEGVGAERDPRAAAQLFRRAAELGLAGAQFWFGRMVMRGEGLPRNLETGAQWILKAAAAGDPQAMLEGARILEMGLGLVSDNARAVALYRAAGDAGVVDAAKRLADAYARGELDLKPDADQAARWAARAKP